MSNVSLRLPNSIHKRVKELAKSDGVSINQFISVALTEKVSVMNAVDYLEKRAKRGSREKFENVLKKVSSISPEPFDILEN